MRTNAKKSSNRRRKTVKKNNKNSQKAVVETLSQPIGFPDIQRTQLRYCDVISLSGTTQQYSFRANSLFDPDFTSTGHQPFYYDQFIAVYQRYRVLSASLLLRVVNTSPSATTSEVVVIPTSLVPTITSISQAKEDSRAKTTGLLPPYQSVTKIVSMNHSTEKIIGLENAVEVYDADYAAAFNANPVQLWYFSLYGFSPTTSGLSVDIDVEIVYNCEFFDRAPVSISLDDQIERLLAIKISKKNSTRLKAQ